MNEPPVGITEAGVLALVRAHWDPAVDRVEHLPVGFGAWHWRASVAGAAEEPGTWVTTHGEPHERNQLLTRTGIVLVDWESLKLAPADRDIRAPGGLFDLEWRLDEIDQYATWFAGPHGDTEDDHEAIAGLEAELTR